MQRRILLFILVIVGICIVYKPLLRSCLIPWQVHSSWVSDLATHRTAFMHWRELSTESIKTRFGGEFPEPVRRANEQKVALVKAYETHSGRVGLRRTYSTVEGGQIVTWLLIDYGHAEYVHDASRDSWGGSPGIDRHRIAKITPGIYRDQKFVAGQAGEGDSVVVVLKLEGDHLDHVFFY